MSSKTFKWNQPSGKVWIVETNIEEKYIKTTDENGNIISDKRDLSEGAIKLVEENFLTVVTSEDIKSEYNPMYA
jgi:hypothetical protein